MAHRTRERKEQKKLKIKSDMESAAKILALNNAKRKIHKKNFSKKKSYEEVIGEINQNLLHKSWFIRNPEDWEPKSYNLERQLYDFIRWVYCIYPVPLFLLKIFDRKRLRAHVNEDNLFDNLILSWVVTIGQGKSFIKEAKDYFSKKEAHLFLSAPRENTIRQNMWWAKCRAVELNPKLTSAFVNITNRWYAGMTLKDEFWSEVLRFFKRYENETDTNTLVDIMDFLVAKRFNDKNFNLKGRTISSLVKLSNDWHKEQLNKKQGNFEWEGLPIDNWKWTDVKTNKYPVKWQMIQIHNSRDLYDEGNRMHHCVGGYSKACADGRSFIFSLRKDDGINSIERVGTIELNANKRIIQARGKCNSNLDKDAIKAVNRWASANGINWYL